MRYQLRTDSLLFRAMSEMKSLPEGSTVMWLHDHEDEEDDTACFVVSGPLAESLREDFDLAEYDEANDGAVHPEPIDPTEQAFEDARDNYIQFRDELIGTEQMPFSKILDAEADSLHELLEQMDLVQGLTDAAAQGIMAAFHALKAAAAGEERWENQPGIPAES